MWTLGSKKGVARINEIKAGFEKMTTDLKEAISEINQTEAQNNTEVENKREELKAFEAKKAEENAALAESRALAEKMQQNISSIFQ